jgi:hypothetical protein
MPGTAGVAAVGSTAAVGLVDFMAVVVDSTAAGLADFTDFVGAGSTMAGSTGIDFTMAGSAVIDFAITGFSSVERSRIPTGGITIRTMAIMTTASPTPRRRGIIAPILPAITPM